MRNFSNIVWSISTCPASRSEIWNSLFIEIYLQSMDPSESWIDQISFEYAIDGVIIFTFCTLKPVEGTFRMEYDQRVIIRFLWNDGVDAHEIIHRRQAQFAEHTCQIRTVQFWITEIRIGRQDLHDEIRTGRPPLDCLDIKMWLYWTNLHLNQLIRYLRDCLLLFQQCCGIYMTLLASNCFIYIGYRICWQTIYARNERSMQELCCHSCILINVMAGIILWLMMTHGFSSIYYHVACGLCREMMWSQNRDLIFRAKISCLQSYRIRAASMLSTDSQMISK
jgi:hypothetical protein